MCLFVLRQRECRRFVAFEGVALVAGIEVGGSGKLSGMLVAVAICTALEFDFKESVFSLRDVAVRAFHFCVAALQRVGAGRVLFHGKGRRLPSLDGVAVCAFSAAGTLGKLTTVRIGLVAVHALIKGQGLLEISTAVALQAVHGLVLTHQRIFRLGVIKLLIHTGDRNFLPTAGGVAGLATLREASSMRIAVAIGTQTERNPGIARLIVGARSMALFALHFRMQPGQRIPRLRVIEFPNSHRFPVLEVMALSAIRTEPPLVLILVTGNAGCGKPQKSFVQVFRFDGCAFRRGYFVGIVALVARQSAVLPFQHVTGLLVVESLGVPLDEREVFPVVIGVATRAFLARSWLDVVGGVQSFMCGNARGDVGVALGTTESGLPSSNFVAGRAIGGAAQELVRTGKRSGRNLRGSRGRKPETDGHEYPKNKMIPSSQIWHVRACQGAITSR